jgi:hypothetical protein
MKLSLVKSETFADRGGKAEDSFVWRCGTPGDEILFHPFERLLELEDSQGEVSIDLPKSRVLRL